MQTCKCNVIKTVRLADIHMKHIAMIENKYYEHSM